MLRLIFCDVDGTLLPKSESLLSPATLDVLRRLTDRGVTVAIASGRPYGSLRPLFPSLTHRLVFLCLDGALTLQRDCVLHKRPLNRAAAVSLLARFPDALVHGRETVYRLGKAPGGDRAVISPNEIGEELLKIELFSDCVPAPEDWFRIAYRQPGLTELVAPCANKGTAARTLMEKFGVAPEQTAAFGDGDNDAALLAAVGHPYLMRGADALPEVPHALRTDNVADTLRELFSL